MVHIPVMLAEYLELKCQQERYNIDDAAKSLAEGATNSVAALYKLQTALINCRPPAPPFLLEDFNHLRENLNVEWNNYRFFLRQCSTYSGYYCNFCDESTPDMSPEDFWESFRKLSTKAGLMQKGADGVVDRCESFYKSCQEHRKKVRLAVISELPPLSDRLAIDRYYLYYQSEDQERAGFPWLRSFAFTHLTQSS